MKNNFAEAEKFFLRALGDVSVKRDGNDFLALNNLRTQKKKSFRICLV